MSEPERTTWFFGFRALTKRGPLKNVQECLTCSSLITNPQHHALFHVREGHTPHGHIGFFGGVKIVRAAHGGLEVVTR